MEWLEKNGKMNEKEMNCIKEKKQKLPAQSFPTRARFCT